jgi:hypothetical protein
VPLNIISHQSGRATPGLQAQSFGNITYKTCSDTFPGMDITENQKVRG